METEEKVDRQSYKQTNKQINILIKVILCLANQVTYDKKNKTKQNSFLPICDTRNILLHHLESSKYFILTENPPINVTLGADEHKYAAKAPRLLLQLLFIMDSNEGS